MTVSKSNHDLLDSHGTEIMHRKNSFALKNRSMIKSARYRANKH